MNRHLPFAKRRNEKCRSDRKMWLFWSRRNPRWQLNDVLSFLFSFQTQLHGKMHLWGRSFSAVTARFNWPVVKSSEIAISRNQAFVNERMPANVTDVREGQGVGTYVGWELTGQAVDLFPSLCQFTLQTSHFVHLTILGGTIQRRSTGHERCGTAMNCNEWIRLVENRLISGWFKITIVILLWIRQSVCSMCWRQWSKSWWWRWGCWLAPGNGHWSSDSRNRPNWQTVVRFDVEIWPTGQHRRVHFLRFGRSVNGQIAMGLSQMPERMAFQWQMRWRVMNEKWQMKMHESN